MEGGGAQVQPPRLSHTLKAAAWQQQRGGDLAADGGLAAVAGARPRPQAQPWPLPKQPQHRKLQIGVGKAIEISTRQQPQRQGGTGGGGWRFPRRLVVLSALLGVPGAHSVYLSDSFNILDLSGCVLACARI